MKEIISNYNQGNNGDITSKVQAQVKNATHKVNEQIEMNLNYLEDLKDMQEKTTDLVEESNQFQKNANDVYQAAWWYNKKMQILIWGSVALVLLLTILFLVRLL